MDSLYLIFILIGILVIVLIIFAIVDFLLKRPKKTEKTDKVVIEIKQEEPKQETIATKPLDSEEQIVILASDRIVKKDTEKVLEQTATQQSADATTIGPQMSGTDAKVLTVSEPEWAKSELTDPQLTERRSQRGKIREYYETRYPHRGQVFDSFSDNDYDDTDITPEDFKKLVALKDLFK